MIFGWWRRIRERKRERAAALRVANLKRQKWLKRKVEAEVELIHVALEAARVGGRTEKVLLVVVVGWLAWQALREDGKRQNF